MCFRCHGCQPAANGTAVPYTYDAGHLVSGQIEDLNYRSHILLRRHLEGRIRVYEERCRRYAGHSLFSLLMLQAVSIALFAATEMSLPGSGGAVAVDIH